VIWRKGSFGDRSANGEVTTARLLTAAGTCVIQRRDELEFLTGSVRRRRTGQPALSLLEL